MMLFTFGVVCCGIASGLCYFVAFVGLFTGRFAGCLRIVCLVIGLDLWLD